MKILAIHKNLVLGGAEKILTDYAKQFKKRGLKFDILLIERSIQFNNLEQLNIHYLINNQYTTVSKLLLILLWPYYFLKLVTLVTKYDVVLSFERYPSYINLFISKLLSKKSVVYIPVPLVPSLTQIFKNKILRKIHLRLHSFVLNNTDLIIAISHGVKKEIIDKFGISENKMAIAEPFIDPNSLDLLAKEPLSPQELNIFKNKKIILTIARLNPQKNLDLLINTFFELNKLIKNTILVIIGEGKERKNLEALIQKLDLQDKIYLLGSKQNPIKYLVKADAFLLTSAYEGLGIVIMEAIYCQIPVITADSIYGVRELFAPKLDLRQKLEQTYFNDFGALIPQTKMAKNNLASALYKVLKDKKFKNRLINNRNDITRRFNSNRKYKLFSEALASIA